MEIEDFRKDFLETARALAATEGDFEEASFVNESARRLVEAEELADFEPCFFEGRGSNNRRLRVDGYSFDDVDGSASLVITHFSGSDVAETLTQTDATRIFAMLRAFIEDAVSGRLHESLEESSPGYGLATDLFRQRESIARFRAFLLTDSVLSTRVKDWPENAIADRPVEFHIWDMARFHRVFESRVGRDELQIDFTEFAEGGIPCLEASQSDGDYRSFLCVLPASTLADIYDRFGSRLLEGNVRSFLSARGKVNKNMRTSILQEPGMFFAYNNGIAATAVDAAVSEGPKGLRLVAATYLQIVNGGQTTASLASARRKDSADLGAIHVQMKLSVISPERAETVIPRISYCANSQNKVSEADFFSNHPFHVRIEEISRRVWAPATGGAQHGTHWFYERARGQYLNEQIKLTPAKKKEYLFQNPREQLISKTDLAKYENAWRGLPHTVCLGAQKNFLAFAQWIGDHWKASDADFNEDFFKGGIAKAIIFRHAERMVTQQPWYQNGYRAQVVAYAVAKLASVIGSDSRGRLLDLRGIWSRQGVSPATEWQLTLIAKAVFDVIVAPDQGFQNVTEWCKKEYCWQRVLKVDVPLDDELARELVGADDVRDARKEAKKGQIVDTGIAAQTAVVKLGGNYWLALLRWGNQRSLLGGEDQKVISIAARMPRLMPTDRQCLVLMDIKRRMEEEGLDATAG